MKKLLFVLVLIMIPSVTLGQSELARDAGGWKIQGVLSPDVAHAVSISTTTARTTTVFSRSVLCIQSTIDAFYKLGTSTIEATTNDHFINADTTICMTHSGRGYLAAITASGSGTLYISEMK